MENYAELKVKYDNLMYEFSENTIIQSMGDMQAVNQCQSDKIDKLMSIINKITENNRAIKILLNVLCKTVSNDKYELKTRLEFIEEVVNMNIQIKREIYYLDYET